MQDGVRRLDDGSLASLAQEVGRLGRLIEDLRLLSSADLGALTYRMESFDLADVIAEAIGAHRRSLDEQQLDCRLQLAEGCIVRADRERIVQVFGNLIQNTLRYTDAPGRVAVALTCSDGDAVVCWDDSSPGVPADRLPWLTERLYRVDESRSRAHGGSGLGLAIVRAIVDAHGGALVAGPSPLGGLRIELRIPLDRGESR
jgi:two-component system, OmpR family, sensor histidine kinase BaeS